MATTWAEIDAKLDIFLRDADEDNTKFSPAQRVAAWNDGQRLLASFHTPRQCVATPLVMESGNRAATLPADFIAAWRLYDSEQAFFYREFRPQASGKRSTDDESPQYWVWGNRLYLECTVDDGADLTLYYWGYWPDVALETVGTTPTIFQGQVLVPQWAELPLLHFTAALCITPEAFEAARRRDYNIQIDSGRPTDNAKAAQAREHLWWWHQILGMVKPVDRTM